MIIPALIIVSGLISYAPPRLPVPVGDDKAQVILIDQAMTLTQKQHDLAQLGIPTEGIPMADTDGRGNYQLSNVKPGKYTVVVMSRNALLSASNDSARCTSETLLRFMLPAHCETLEVVAGDNVKWDWSFRP